MEWKDVENALPGGLKLLGAALSVTGVGAPVGAAVAGIGALVGHALGVDGSSPDAVLDAVHSDPAAAEKLLEVQEATKQQLQQLIAAKAIAELQSETAQQTAVLADKANARGRDIEVIKAGKMNVRADLMLLFAFIAGVVICWLLAEGGVAEASAAGGFMMTVGGMFARNIGTAFDFEFGSSRSSMEKTDALAGIARQSVGTS